MAKNKAVAIVWRTIERFGGAPVSIFASDEYVNWLGSASFDDAKELISADTFIGLMAAALAASALFLTAYEQNDARENEIRKIRETVGNTAVASVKSADREAFISFQKSALSAFDSSLSTFNVRSNHLILAAFSFLICFLYATGGLACHIGFDELIRIEEGNSQVSIAHFLSLTTLKSDDVLCSLGLLGATLITMVLTALRAIVFMYGMLPKLDE